MKKKQLLTLNAIWPLLLPFTYSFAPTSRHRLICLTLRQESPSSSDRMEARKLVGEGMQAFRQGNVAESIEIFDQADRLQSDGSLHPYLWQRGLSLYYADDFAGASAQFRDDVKVNPTDVEEIVWDIASQLRANPSRFPVPNQMSLPPGANDRRRIMPTVYRLFRGEGSEQELAEAGHGFGASPADEFYSLFYLGLFCEARQELTKAASYMVQAVKTEYAQSIGKRDYMTSCALDGYERENINCP